MASAQFKTAERRQNSTEYRRLFDMASRLYSEAQQANDRILMRKAAKIAHQGYLLKPDHLTGLNLMARIDMQLGHYDDDEIADFPESYDWATVGTLQKVRSDLMETLRFFAGFETTEDIQRSLDEMNE